MTGIREENTCAYHQRSATRKCRPPSRCVQPGGEEASKTDERTRSVLLEDGGSRRDSAVRSAIVDTPGPTHQIAAPAL